MAEALPVLGRINEGFDHLRATDACKRDLLIAYVFARDADAVQFVQPELEAFGVGIAPQVSEVFHQDERAVVERVEDRARVGNFGKHARACLRAVVESGDERVARRGFGRGVNARVGKERVDVVGVRDARVARAKLVAVDEAVEELPTVGGETFSRRSTTVIRPNGRALATGPFRQVSRLGNPLVNEVIIPLGLKDTFNRSTPANDAQFASFVVDPQLARLLKAVFGINIPDPPRNDEAQREYEAFEAAEHEAASEENDMSHLALFWADRDKNLYEALELARRSDIYTCDTHAWAHFKKGQLTEARAAIDEALRLNTRAAKINFHAGMIYRALGDEARAAKHLRLALKINPAFNVIQAEAARQPSTPSRHRSAAHTDDDTSERLIPQKARVERDISFNARFSFVTGSYP